MYREEWRQVTGVRDIPDGVYSVSSLGRVRREVYGQGCKGQHKIKKLIVHKSGYAFVPLYWNNKCTGISVHRLVATAFLGPKPKGFGVNHKNCIKTDNRAVNLEYMTDQENLEHARVNGLFRRCSHPRENNGNSKLTESQVLVIRRDYRLGLGEKMAKKYGVSRRQIWSIMQGKSWKLNKGLDAGV